MKKVLVFGTGDFYKKKEREISKAYEVIGYIDNDANKQDAKKKIYDISCVNRLKYDEIVVCSNLYIVEMLRQLLEFGVPLRKINVSLLWDNLYQEGDDLFVISCGVTAKLRLMSPTEGQVAYELGTMYVDIEGLTNCVFVDVGMNVGLVSMFYAQKSYITKVYSYEPFEETYNLAIDNFSLNEADIVKKIEHYNIGLGGCGERRYVASYNILDSHVASTINSQQSSSNHSTSVVIKNAATELSRIINENTGSPVICKIDAEGSEYEIFDVLDEGELINKIDVIIMEYHPNVPGRNHLQLREILSKNNFSVNERSCPRIEGLGVFYAINNKHDKSVCFDMSNQGESNAD